MIRNNIKLSQRHSIINQLDQFSKMFIIKNITNCKNNNNKRSVSSKVGQAFTQLNVYSSSKQ